MNSVYIPNLLSSARVFLQSGYMQELKARILVRNCKVLLDSLEVKNKTAEEAVIEFSYYYIRGFKSERYFN